MLQIGAASLLQVRASVVTNWGSYYKLGQPLLQNKAAITNWGKMYYKYGQALQIRAMITNWDITYVNCKNVYRDGHKLLYIDLSSDLILIMEMLSLVRRIINHSLKT